VGVTAVVAILVATVAISYASEQSEHLSTNTSRVTEAKTFRGPYWDVALQSFADHPLDGVGSGSFRVEWRRKNVVPRGAFDAHSLYFETLGELGIVGGLLLAVFIGAIAAGLVRRVSQAPRDPVLPAAAAALAAYAVHVGVDWDWELPALILPALLLAAAALVRPEPDLGWRR
jgi:O-antigen ligase